MCRNPEPEEHPQSHWLPQSGQTEINCSPESLHHNWKTDFTSDSQPQRDPETEPLLLISDTKTQQPKRNPDPET